MTLTVTTNLSALTARLGIATANKEADVALERLSTGKRINSAKDDAAGVAISSRLESNIRGLNQATRNALDAQALLDTADGALKETDAILQRMRELAVQAANDTNSASDRRHLDLEAQQLMNEIDHIAKSTTWAGKNLLDGTFAGKVFQIGANNTDGDQLAVTIKGSRAIDLFDADYTQAEVNDFENGGFDTHEVEFDGNFLVPGWQLFENQMFLGSIGNNQASVVSGYSAPIDPTPRPENSLGQVSRGDNFVPSSASYDISIEGGVLRLTSSISTAEGGDVVHGPYIVSDRPIFLAEGASVSFDWQATGGNDAFDVFAYLIDVDSGEATVILNETGGADGESTPLSSVELLIEKSSNYKFVFVSGTFDYSFGRAAGASLMLDNIRIEGNSDPSDHLGAPFDLSSRESSNSSIAIIDVALGRVNDLRSLLGSLSNRLEHVVASNTDISISHARAKGQIDDADFASESTKLAKAQILLQASIAMLAQANASKRDVLELLKS
jgi:flagellin